MNYDVVVVGGGTSGCAAAYTLAKGGKKVLLVEKCAHLGGTMTSALVTPMMKTSENSINNEFTDIFLSKMRNYNAAITYEDGNSGWFNPEIAKIVLDELMQEVGVEVLFNSTLRNVNISDSYIKSIEIQCNMLSVCIDTICVIDATGNCDVGILGNCEFLDDNAVKQPTTLRFIMGGVDLKRFGDWLLGFDKDRDVTTACNLDGQIHLSTAYTWDLGREWALKPLFDKAVDDKILQNEDRNYFQVFSVPGMLDSIAFNCPRIYFDTEIDPLDVFDSSKALLKARGSILRLSNFCKQYLVGFENAYISNIADMLGVRESRRIRGKYVYTIDDLKNGKTFENPVLISNYPVDVHSNKKDNSVLEHTMQEYQLPVESLMSKDIENLFVIGRCLSADFYAQAALRIIPSCFSMGVGVAKYLLKNL